MPFWKILDYCLRNKPDFRKGNGTTDHIFSLKLLIDLYPFKKKHLYCAFCRL